MISFSLEDLFNYEKKINPKVKMSINRTRKLGLFTLICAITSNVMFSQETVQLKVLKEFHGYYRAYFSPDSRKVALFRKDRINIVWVPGGKAVCTIVPSSSELTFDSAVFSQDGKSLIVNSDSWKAPNKTITQEILFFDLSTCGQTRKLEDVPSHDVGKYISVSGGGRFLATSADTASVWDLSDGSVAYRYQPPSDYSVKKVLISPDGHNIAVYSESLVPLRRSRILGMVDITSKRIRELSHDHIADFHFSADSSLLVTTSYVGEDLSGGGHVSLRAYNVSSGNVVYEIESTDFVHTFALSPTHDLVAGGGIERFRIYSLPEGIKVGEYYHHKPTKTGIDLKMVSFLSHMEFSPDGTMLASGGEDGTIKLWKVARNGAGPA